MCDVTYGIDYSYEYAYRMCYIGKIPIPTVEEDVYIYDEDNIVDDDVEENLNKMLVELEEKTEVEFAVVSVESLLDRSIEDYANNLFNTLGVGKKEKTMEYYFYSLGLMKKSDLKLVED